MNRRCDSLIDEARELTGKSKILNKLVAVIGRDKVDALLA